MTNSPQWHYLEENDQGVSFRQLGIPPKCCENREGEETCVPALPIQRVHPSLCMLATLYNLYPFMIFMIHYSGCQSSHEMVHWNAVSVQMKSSSSLCSARLQKFQKDFSGNSPVWPPPGAGALEPRLQLWNIEGTQNPSDYLSRHSSITVHHLWCVPYSQASRVH